MVNALAVPTVLRLPELQIRKDDRDNLETMTIFFHKNIFCDPSLESSRRDGSNEGSQHMFLLKKKKIIFQLSSIPLISATH